MSVCYRSRSGMVGGQTRVETYLVISILMFFARDAIAQLRLSVHQSSEPHQAHTAQ